MIRFETSLGAFTIELFEKDAPVTVQNFLDYVDAGHFDGTVFHRVIPGFVVQGGGMTEDMKQKSTRAPIKNEADNGVKNRRGTLSMARTNDPHSATSQFFINLVDNSSLDPGRGGAGYAVFGCVSDGHVGDRRNGQGQDRPSRHARRRAGRADQGHQREARRRRKVIHAAIRSFSGATPTWRNVGAGWRAGSCAACCSQVSPGRR